MFNVMQHAIEDCGRDHTIAKDFAPGRQSSDCWSGSADPSRGGG